MWSWTWFDKDKRYSSSNSCKSALKVRHFLSSNNLSTRSVSEDLCSVHNEWTWWLSVIASDVEKSVCREVIFSRLPSLASFHLHDLAPFKTSRRASICSHCDWESVCKRRWSSSLTWGICLSSNQTPIESVLPRAHNYFFRYSYRHRRHCLHFAGWFSRRASKKSLNPLSGLIRSETT